MLINIVVTIKTNFDTIIFIKKKKNVAAGVPVQNI
jgi:hypothetical protein